MKSALIVAVWAILLGTMPLRAGLLTDDQQAGYRQLRKDFIIAMAVRAAPAGAKMRREHRRFLRDINRFLKKIGNTAPPCRAASLYFRARLALKVRRPEQARKDLDTAVECLGKPKTEDEELPGGMPSRTALQIFRAFTFIDAGSEKVMSVLEAIPEDAPKPAYHEVGSLLGNWADALAEHEQESLALRAYGLIVRFSLWEDEADNPKRKMDLIKYRQNGGMMPQANE